VTSITIPSGVTTYTFDGLNRMSTVTDPEGDVTRYSYNSVGNLETTEFANGTTESRVYDDLNRLVFLETVGPAGVVASFDYTLDAVGNRTHVLEHSGREVAYEYDELYRLIGESISDSAQGDQTINYTYDDVGNRLTRDDSGDGLTTYDYDENARLLTEVTNGVTASYTYDDNGNTLSRETATDAVFYDWDYENRLVAADTNGDGNINVENEYDADGIRVEQSVDGDATRFLLDKNQTYTQVLEEYTPGGVIKVIYVHGSDLISQDRPAETGKSFHVVDGLGSTRALIDRMGVLTDHYIYDAFGRMIDHVGSTDNLYLFAGERRDSMLRTDYLRARYLAFAAGRFLTADPHGGWISSPATLHPFLYARANPVNWVDPSGEFSLASLNAAVSARQILSAIALPNVAFPLLTAKVIHNVIGPAIRGRHTALSVIGSSTSGPLLDAAFDLYSRSNNLIALGAHLIEINKAAIDFAQAFVNLSSGVTSLATATGNVQLIARSIDLGSKATNILKETNNFVDTIQTRFTEPSGGPFDASIDEFQGLLIGILSELEATFTT
jgi:RHS repeat-associated protein